MSSGKGGRDVSSPNVNHAMPRALTERGAIASRLQPQLAMEAGADKPAPLRPDQLLDHVECVQSLPSDTKNARLRPALIPPPPSSTLRLLAGKRCHSGPVIETPLPICYSKGLPANFWGFTRKSPSKFERYLGWPLRIARLRSENEQIDRTASFSAFYCLKNV